MSVLIAAIFLIAIILSFAGQGAAYYNTKQDNKRAWEECLKNQDEWARRTSKEHDVYYSPITKSIDTNFYSDGSLKVDAYTKKTYAKGQYKCDSRGNTAEWVKAAPDVKRPPTA